jgi:hypothetical protein
MGRFKGFTDSVREVLWITRSTVSTFWFWLPMIYFVYIIVQLWLVFYVHPLTLAIVPVAMVVYGVRMEEKRIRIRYGLHKTKRLSGTQGIGASPEPVKEAEWKIQQAVDQYTKLLRDKNTEDSDQ